MMSALLELTCASLPRFLVQAGLGKTLQAIAVAAAYHEEWPLLVIAPSGLRANWIDEIRHWLPQQWLDAPAPAASWVNRKKVRKKTADTIPAAVHAVASADELPSNVDSLAPITIVSYDLLPKLSGATECLQFMWYLCTEDTCQCVSFGATNTACGNM